MLPLALQCGISYREFWHLTPAAILAIENAYNENRKFEEDLAEQQAWLTGEYVLAAINVAFSKKHIDYPENPLSLREKQRTDFTEEEKEKYVEALFGQLDTMQKSFEAHNGGSRKKEKK